MEKWYKIHLLSSVFNMLPPILASKNFILVSPHLSQGPSGDPEIQIRVLHSRFVLSFFLPSSLSFLRPPFLSDCTAFLWALFLNTDLVQRTLANHSPQGPWHSQAFQQCTWMIAGGVPQRWKVPVTLFERPVPPPTPADLGTIPQAELAPAHGVTDVCGPTQCFLLQMLVFASVSRIWVSAAAGWGLPFRWRGRKKKLTLRPFKGKCIPSIYRSNTQLAP